MKNLSRILMLLALIPMLVLMSCKDNDEPDADQPFEIMTTYMMNNNLDVSDVLSDWIVGPPASAEEVPAFLSNYHVMDVRAAEAFDGNHIEGAVNTSLGTILDDAASATKPILVVCYTGQSAGHAVMALRLSGYPDAKVLKFGMSQWNSATEGPWNGSTGDVGVGHANWSMGAVADIQEFELPSFTSDEMDGAAILAERVQFMIEKGFQGIANTEVLSSPDNYFVNNFWDETDTEHYGHINGAYRIKPLSLANNEIKNLDPNETIVSYCWTGQTSSMLTAYLTVLGYDAKSLKFGTNGMIYSELESHKFSPPSVDLPVVTE
ncbi:MAG: hypothetical protein JXQ90_04980 [Cyclobacteriaceae bacterium]